MALIPTNKRIAATIATTRDLAQPLSTSNIRPGIFTAASSLESLETHSPSVPSFAHFRRSVANPCPSAALLMQRQCNSSFAIETHGTAHGIPFEIPDTSRNPGLTCWNGRFRPVDDAVGLGADAAAETPVTQTQSPVTQTQSPVTQTNQSRRHSHQPNPSSPANFQKPVPVPLSLTPYVTSPYFS